MDSLASVRLTANLNSMINGQQTLEQAERAVAGPRRRPPRGRPGRRARARPARRPSSLDDALERAATTPSAEGWFLGLPVPGSLAPLRGPAAFNRAALEHGEAVVASAAGLGLVPIRVGPAVQWRVFAAERPLAPASPYEAERALNEMVLSRRGGAEPAGRGRRPATRTGVRLRCWPPGYSTPAAGHGASGRPGCWPPATPPWVTTGPASRRSRPTPRGASSAGSAPRPARRWARRSAGSPDQ